MIIEDCLPKSKEKAVSPQTLAAQLGFPSVRALQKAIERERRAGGVILSTTESGGGYFKSDDPAEISAFIKTLNRRARATQAATLSAQAELDRLSGQSVIDGFRLP